MKPTEKPLARVTSGFSVLPSFVRVLRSLFDRLAFLDLARTQTAGANQNPLGTAIHNGADGLKVRHLAAQVHAGNVQPDSAFLLGFTAAGNFTGLDGAFGTDVTNLSHGTTPL